MINYSKQRFQLALVSAIGLAAPAVYAADIDTIATGLHNPRGLSVSEGVLYVAEAGLGAGGHDASAIGIGPTGSIIAIYNPLSSHAYARPVVTDLASVDDPVNGVTGPDGLSVRDKKIYIIETESSSAILKNLLGSTTSLTDADLDTTKQFGQLLVASSGDDADDRDEAGNRRIKSVANLGDIDYAWTGDNQAAAFAPLGQFPDANPYAVLSVNGHQYIADAGSNTIDEVTADGSVRIIAYLPNPPVSDAVPTCLALGSDHELYVGTLAFGANLALGGGGATPQSKVYRFDPAAFSSIQFLTEANVWASGFFPITGCGFADDSFYVTEFWTSLAPPGGGDVVRIIVNGDKTAGPRTHLGAGKLNTPNGFAADRDGSIYVSNNSTSDSGSVVRIKP